MLPLYLLLLKYDSCIYLTDSFRATESYLTGYVSSRVLGAHLFSHLGLQQKVRILLGSFKDLLFPPIRHEELFVCPWVVPNYSLRCWVLRSPRVLLFHTESSCSALRGSPVSHHWHSWWRGARCDSVWLAQLWFCSFSSLSLSFLSPG